MRTGATRPLRHARSPRGGDGTNDARVYYYALHHPTAVLRKEPSMNSKTVLLVEDQIEFLAIYKLYLERNGYNVLVAEDGEAAVRCAREHHPELILMDFSVPLLDGIGATTQLKRDPGTRDIPVVLITAHAYGSVGRRAR